MLKRNRIVVGLAGLALAGGAVGISTAVSGATQDDSAPDGTSLETVGKPAGDGIPQGLQRILARPDGGAASGLGLDASKVREVQLSSSSDSVWLVPTADGGLCISNSSGGTSCTADASTLARSGLTLTRLPSPPPEYGQAIVAAQKAGLSGAAAKNYVRNATAGGPGVHGSAQYVGYAPAGVASLSLVDADGAVIASTKPHDLIFDFTIPDVATVNPTSVRFQGGSIEEPVTLPNLDSIYGR
jgi:hypothetical protein